MEELSFAANPFIVLSYVTGPAFLTNATAMFLNSTSARFGRSIDRSRHLTELLADPSTVRLIDSIKTELDVVQRRVRLIARALSSLYLAAAMFALATLLSISGAVVAEFTSGIPFDVVVFAAVGSGLVGFAAFVGAALMLVIESQLAVRSLAAEAADAAALDKARRPRGG